MYKTISTHCTSQSFLTRSLVGRWRVSSSGSVLSGETSSCSEMLLPEGNHIKLEQHKSSEISRISKRGVDVVITKATKSFPNQTVRMNGEAMALYRAKNLLVRWQGYKRQQSKTGTWHQECKAETAAETRINQHKQRRHVAIDSKYHRQKPEQYLFTRPCWRMGWTHPTRQQRASCKVYSASRGPATVS